MKKWESSPIIFLPSSLLFPSLPLSVCVSLLVLIRALNSRNLLSHCCGGCNSKIKMSLGLVSPEASLSGLQMTPFLLAPHMAFPVCMPFPGFSFSSCKDTGSVELGAYPLDAFNWNSLFTGLISKYCYMGRWCSNIRIWGEQDSVHMTIFFPSTEIC